MVESVDTARLIYVSTAAEPISPAMLDDILMTARTRNAQSDITGLLCVVGNHFMQLLEGPERAVNGVFESIRHDKRHKDVMIIHTEATCHRQFPEWSMGFAQTSSAWTEANDNWVRVRPAQLEDLLPADIAPEVRMLFLSFRGASDIHLAEVG
jgi:hypothetical protein